MWLTESGGWRRPRRLLASMFGGAAPSLGGIARRLLPLGLPCAALAWLAISAILAKAGGPALPLDDSFIHLQFARSIAHGTPLVYSPGSPPVPGATSLLWPALLSFGAALGLHETALAWEAWALGFIALGLLANEARVACERLASSLAGWGAALLVLAFGANVWFAASGMEVVPLAWLLLRSVRRAAEWCEGRELRRERARLLELLALAVLSPLMRPEGALASMLIAAVLVACPRERSALARALGIVAVAGALSPGAINWLLTGQFASTTAQSKWLPFNPYSTRASLFDALAEYVHTLVATLLNGEVWSSVFLPRGSRLVALLSLAALPIVGAWRRVPVRAGLLLLLALGILIPGSYDCPLCNRLRYLWPFLPAWFVGTAALCDGIGEQLARFRPELRGFGLLLLGCAAGALLGHLPFALDDLGTSASAICQQQVSLAYWARDELPSSARIGVNDTGAITYLSGHSTFDVVGLTTLGEAKYWTAGAGSRFEHYERLGRDRLPTHFIVYPEWFVLDDLLGDELTARDVPNATILGGRRMAAYVADWRLLGSGRAPAPESLQGLAVIDELDVADIDSEKSHGFVLGAANQLDDTLVHIGERADGARAARTRDQFTILLEPGGALVLRVATRSPTPFEIRVAGQTLSAEAPASLWHELRVALPDTISRGRQGVSVETPGASFASLHYFSLGSAAAAPELAPRAQ